MKRKLSTALLFIVLSILTARAQDRQQVFPARPFWYNPGAISFDTCHAVSGQMIYFVVPERQDFSRVTDAQFTAEIRLPKRYGAMGMQYFTEPAVNELYKHIYNLAYAYSFPIAGGRLGIGLQGNIIRRPVSMTFFNGNVFINQKTSSQADISFGAYYNLGNLSAGISGQNLLATSAVTGANTLGFLHNMSNIRHIRGMIGYNFLLAPTLQLNTAALLDHSEQPRGTRIESQFSANLIYNKQWHAGFLYTRQSNFYQIWVNAGFRTKTFEIFAGAASTNISPWITIIPIRAGVIFLIPDTGKSKSN